MQSYRPDEQQNPNDLSGALHTAAKHGDITAIEKLLAKNVDVNSAYNGKTPIMIALENHHIQVVTLLLNNQAFLELKNLPILTAVHALIKQHNNTQDFINLVKAFMNCDLSKEAIIQLLPNVFSEYNNKAFKEDILEMIKQSFILEERAQRCTEALDAGHPIGFIIRLERRPHEWGKNKGVIADIEKILSEANNALATNKDAAQMEMGDADELSREGIISIEENNGVLFNLNDPKAIKISIFSAIFKGDMATIDNIIEQDPRVLHRIGRGLDETPLHHAIMLGKLDIAKHLIEKGAPINIKNRRLATPLHSAIEAGELDFVRYLLSKGANMTAGNSFFGDTPMHIAITKGNVDIVNELLKHQPDLMQTNNFNVNCYQEAARSNHPDILKIFMPLTPRDMRANILSRVCHALKTAQEGKRIIEILEVILKFYRARDIINGIRMAFEGKCDDKIQLSIVEAIRNSSVENGDFERRLTAARSYEHPLGTFMYMHTSVLDMFVKTNSKAQTLLETLTPHPTTDEIVSEFEELIIDPTNSPRLH